MLLAIDTSTRHGGVSLWREDHAVATLCWHSQRNHTAELMPAIDQVLTRARVGPGELEAVAMALGPGGFSSLRVGISAAKGLATGLGVPAVGVGTLELEAYPYAGMGLPIHPVIDAGRGDLATATYQKLDGRWQKTGAERVCTMEELVRSVSGPAVVCGEGTSSRGGEIEGALGGKGMVLEFHTSAVRLWALGTLALERVDAQAGGLAALQPMYLRRPSIGKAGPRREVRK